MQITNYKVLRDQYGINYGCEKLDRAVLASMIKEALALVLKNGFDFFSVNKIPGSGNSMYRGLEMGNNRLPGNGEAFDQRLSEGHLWRKK